MLDEECPRGTLNDTRSFAGTDAFSPKRDLNLIEDRRIVDRRGHGPGVAVGDLLHRSSQDLSGASLGQARDGDCELECGDRADLLADQLNDFLLDLSLRTVDAGFEHNEA